MPQSLLVAMVVTAFLALAAAEVLSLVLDNRHVILRCEADMTLTEPGETVTLTYRVRNTAFWPLCFVGFSVLFPEGVELREDESWKQSHAVGSLVGKMYSFETGLLPHRVLRGRIRFALTRRGVHSLGKIYVQTGDFLGFRSSVRSFEIPGSIICTAAPAADAPALEPLGGFLGDVSVRRFILEDPGIVLGYREYTGREPMNRISWTQTAKNGCLTVKSHDYTVDTDVAVLVDLEQCAKPLAERCLSLTRTVCDRLEAERIPYALLSNGDLSETAKGVGRMHSFEIQRRLGLSRFVRYRAFSELADQCAARGPGRRGWIVITPARTAELESVLARLQAAADGPLCVLVGEEGEHA